MHIAIVGGKRVRIRLADDLREERLAQREPRPTFTIRSGRCRPTCWSRVSIRSSTTCSPCATWMMRRRRQGQRNATTVRGHGARLQCRGARGLYPLVRVAGGRDASAEPLQGAPNSGARTRGAASAPDVPARLIPTAICTASFKPVRNFTADLSGTCTGSMLVQHMAGSGVAQDLAVSTPSFFDMNIRLSYDVRIYKEITMQPLWRCAEPVQRLPEGLRQGCRPRLGLHLRPVAAPQLVRRREVQFLIPSLLGLLKRQTSEV